MEMHYLWMDVMGLVPLKLDFNASESQVFAVFVGIQFEMEQNNVMTGMLFQEMDVQVFVNLNLGGLVYLKFYQMCVIYVEIV